MEFVWLVKDVEKDMDPMIYASEQSARKAVANMIGVSIDDTALDNIMDGNDTFISVKKEMVID